MNSFDQFQSPFSWRYGSEEMRKIWSERNKRRLWRRIWISLAKAESLYGLVNSGQIAELEAHAEDIDFEKAQEFEKSIRHDLMAELRTYRIARVPARAAYSISVRHPWISKTMPMP